MTGTDIHAGMIVEHPAKPEWGPGKVARIRGEVLEVFFRDLPGTRPKKFKVGTLRVAAAQRDPILDNLPNWIEREGELFLPHDRMTLAQARERFLQHFPGGFSDPAYIGTPSEGERTYKWLAHERYINELGDGRGRELLHRREIAELVRRLFRSVGSASNLAAMTENIAFREGLRDEEAASRYFSSLFDLVEAGPTEAAFTVHAQAVASLPSAGATHTDKWTIATLLPFLARPDVFMFVKPNSIKAAAAALGFEIHYDPRPNWRTYEAVLRMSREYMNQLADLGPRDFIDVQSFFWVVGDTYEETLKAQQAKRERQART